MRRWLGILAVLCVVITTATGCYTCHPGCVAGICDCAPIDYAYHCAVYAGPEAGAGHHGDIVVVPSGSSTPTGPVRKMEKVAD